MSSSSAGPIDVDVDGSDALSSFTHAWLIQNILSDATASVQRSLLYAAYVVDCQSNALVPLNEIGFGRVLRSLFPGVLTRRFGVRGATTYHYVGILYNNNSASMVTADD